jgi:4-hydroxy-2-oxoheptanedioate aldolase
MYSNIQMLREKLDTGRLCLGSGVTLADPAVTEALGACVDFVCVDMEQHPTSLESLSSHLMAARAVQTAALVRTPDADPSYLRRVLDAGAEGVVVPHLRSAAQVREMTAECRYAPVGRRTVGPRRVLKQGRRTTAEWMRYVNQHLFVAVHVDSPECLAEMDEIVAVPGLDGVVLGMDALDPSCGQSGRFDDSQSRLAIARVIQQVRAAGRYVGADLRSPDPELALAAGRLGVHFLQCGDDFSHMTKQADRLYTEIRRRTEEVSAPT